MSGERGREEYMARTHKIVDEFLPQRFLLGLFKRCGFIKATFVRGALEARAALIATKTH